MIRIAIFEKNNTRQYGSKMDDLEKELNDDLLHKASIGGVSPQVVPYDSKPTANGDKEITTVTTY